MPPPLEHLRVIDLTDLRGALAARFLADLGADVLRIERDPGDPLQGRESAHLFRNANKRDAAIASIDSGPGRERFEELCSEADALIENLSPEERAPPRPRAGNQFRGVLTRSR